MNFLCQLLLDHVFFICVDEYTNIDVALVVIECFSSFSGSGEPVFPHQHKQSQIQNTLCNSTKTTSRKND